jgi:glycosyltransferase involved in cell wall biosynthesis
MSVIEFQPQRMPTLPSFSVIIETENLATAELAGLMRCLEALAAQTPSPAVANEVLILESGDVPPALIEQLCATYPWLTVRRIEAGTDYYAAKMKGVAMTTGEVLILADSDCIYEPNWLQNLLTPFATQPDVQVVAGETMTTIPPRSGLWAGFSGAYSLAMAIVYIFPNWSLQPGLRKSHYYFCNNVAFRRSCLLEHPIPAHLPLYRGNCVVHALTLMRCGVTIWRQPQSRASHAAPNGWSHFFWRFLLLGYDALSVYRLRRQPVERLSPRPAWLADLGAVGKIAFLKLKTVGRRSLTVLTQDPRRILDIPLALPITVAALTLFFTGLAISYVRPNFFLTEAGAVEARWEHS